MFTTQDTNYALLTSSCKSYIFWKVVSKFKMKFPNFKFLVFVENYKQNLTNMGSHYALKLDESSYYIQIAYVNLQSSSNNPKNKKTSVFK